MYPLSNRQINSILSRHYHTKYYYHGCFSFDTLPRRVEKYPSFYVCNTASSKERGEHWLLIGFTARENKGELFDSLGGREGSHPREIYQFLYNNSSGGIKMNSEQYQSSDSLACGYFCLYFGDLRCRDMSYDVCLRTLNSHDTDANEDLVVRYVSKHMRI